MRYYTDSGYTDEQHLWLCSDGTFARRGAAGGFGGGASGAFQSDSTGRWQATGAGANGTLTLQYSDGSVARHELYWDYEKNRLHLDGKRCCTTTTSAAADPGSGGRHCPPHPPPVRR